MVLSLFWSAFDDSYESSKNTDSDLLIDEACEVIRATNNLVAMETIEIIDKDIIKIRPLDSLKESEYQKNIRTEDDPESRSDFLSKIVGLFVYPNQVFVDTNLDQKEIERTIVHEVQHYRYHHIESNVYPIDVIEDEMLAIEAEDRYAGRYITRLYIKELRERVVKLFATDH